MAWGQGVIVGGGRAVLVGGKVGEGALVGDEEAIGPIRASRQAPWSNKNPDTYDNAHFNVAIDLVDMVIVCC